MYKAQVLFVQGGGEGAHDRWDDELVARLERELGEGYTVRYPRMPNEADPRYRAWKTALFEEFERLEDGAILVGHSVGGVMLVHALVERPPRFRPGGIFLLAAPFIGEGGWPSDEIRVRRDFSGSLPRGVPVALHHGAEDKIVPVGHVHLYAKAIPHAKVRICAGSDHQLGNDMAQIARAIRSLRELR
jgi:predicted alpha/beta hydrolase family esterase